MNPVVLVILDGWGISTNKLGNSILNANLPNYNFMLNNYLNYQIEASGIHVGLPDKLMGNSEVGHLTIGSGKSVIQKLTLISNTINNGSFFTNEILLNALNNVQKNNSKLHILGLLSDGCVHSSLDHLWGLLEMTRRHKTKQVVIHPILDGRDTPPRSSLKFIKDLNSRLMSNEQIGVISGRFYAMDRDKRWDRIEKYYNALVLGNGQVANDALTAIGESYINDVNDEFIEPTIINNLPIEDNDSVICFNFRPDRVREISSVLTNINFDGFNRVEFPHIHYVCMTEYDASLNLPVAFDAHTMKTEDIKVTLPEILSCHHIKQLHVAETEKYAHVTYFFNGGKEEKLANEDRMLIPSLKVNTYDLAPSMQTPEICKLVCSKIANNEYPFIVLNFANPDMVGHTGNQEAAILACESVDRALADLLAAIRQAKGSLVVTADHGNVEQMIDYVTNEPHTAHTNNKVPLIIASFNPANSIERLNQTPQNLSLVNVAPTILSLMGLAIPPEMNNDALVKVKALI